MARSPRRPSLRERFRELKRRLRGETAERIGDGPYRSGPARKEVRRRRWTYALVAVVLGAPLLLMIFAGKDEDPLAAASLEALPPVFVGHVGVFPPADAPLRPATPLDPLLAADGPERLALREPSMGATRLQRSQPLHVVFNRPMVEATAVGPVVEDPPIEVRFRSGGPVRGTARWSSRSRLIFHADGSAWSGVREATLRVEPELSAVDGEAFGQQPERTLVFDGTPHLLASGGQRVGAGAPLPLYFDNAVAAGELRRDVMAYEIGGGARTVPFRLVARGWEEARYRLDLLPGRGLEPGAQIGVALAPRWTRWAGATPAVARYTVQPRPHVEGVGCAADAIRTGRCDHGTTPGQVVDIGPELRILATEPLAPSALTAIRVTPALPQMVATFSEQGARLLTISGEWAADQVYEVRLPPLRTASGERLEPFAPLAVRSRGHRPTVQVPEGRLAFERDDPGVLRMRGIATGKGALLQRAVPDSDAAALQAALDPATFVTHAPDRYVPLSRLLPEARPNRWGEGRYAWAKTQGEGPAMAVVGVRPGEDGASGTRALFAQRTNLGTTVRVTREGALVWVSRLHDATAVRGARVRLADEEGTPIGEATTDAEGAAWIATDEDRTDLRQAVLVSHADDRAVVVLERGAVVGPAQMNVAVAHEASDDALPRVSVFTDRGAYRPGSALHVRLGVHEREGHGPVPDLPLRVRVQTPGAVVPDLEQTVRTGRWGSASATFTLPPSMTIGTKEVVVVRPRAGEAEDEASAEVRLASTPITVAQFRDPTFRVDLGLPRRVLAGETLTARVDGRYLFGAPLANGELRHSLLRRSAAPHAPRWRELTFAPAGHFVEGSTLAAGTGHLDDAGRAELELGALEATVRHEVVFEAEVADRSGQATAAHRTVTVHPAALEVGLERGPSWIAHCSGDDCEGLRAAVAVVDMDDAPVAGRSVEVGFYREGWHDWWQWSSGQYQARQQHRRERVGGCTLQSVGEALASCVHQPERAGTYVIEATVSDDEGRRALASRRVYVAGPDDAPDRDPAGTRIALTPKKLRYAVGEVAELAIESPWPAAELLVSVERDGVLHRSRERVGSGGHVVRVPVTEAMVPNAFVSVALIRPRLGEPGERMDLLGPDLRFAMASIQARPAEAAVAVTVDAPETASPGEEVTVRVHADRDAEVVLWAVDEGILRLTGWWTTPNPTEALYPSEGAAFAWEDLRRMLAARVAPAEQRAGGDGGGSAEQALRPTEPVSVATPLWAPHLETDANGNAEATFTVPDRDTEYRIVAVAIDERGASGSATGQLVAKRAVVAREALPTFATEGDRFEATFFLTNTGEEGRSVRLRTTVGTETTTERIFLHPGRERRIVRAVTVPEAGARELPVFLEARTREGTQRVGRTLPIAPAARWTRRHAFGAVGGASETRPAIGLRFPEGATGRARLVVAAHPFLGARLIDEGLGGWTDLEHRAARALVAVSQLQLQEGVDLALDADELRARAQLAIDALLEHQNAQGGFGRYDAQGWSTPVEGTLAVHALVVARQAELRVPETAHTRALAWLEDLSRRAAFGSAYGVSASDAETYALHVLREGGIELPELVDAAFERRDGLGYAGRGHLALAMDAEDDRRETLVVEAAELARAEVRDPSLPYAVAAPPVSAWERGALLEAASRTAVGHRHASPLASELLGPSATCGQESCAPVPPWASPIERIAAARALVAYASLFRRSSGGVALPMLDGEPLGAREVGATRLASFELPVERLARANELTFAGGGEGPTFYTLEAEWAEPLGFEERTARGRGVSLHRRYERTDGRALASGDGVRLGETIRVRLFLHTESNGPANVRLADPLGAGFTAVDDRLDAAPDQALRRLVGMGPEDEVMDPRARIAARTAGAIAHRELEQNVALTYFEDLPLGLQEVTYAVRATTPGEFRIPPAQIDSARDDDFEAHSALFTLRVVTTDAASDIGAAESESEPE